MPTATDTQSTNNWRNHERQDETDTQRLVAGLCQAFEYGPSKASRLVRRFQAQSARWAQERPDLAAATFVDFLITEAVATRNRRADLIKLFTDPTGDAAVRNVMKVDPRGDAARGRWASKYEDRLERNLHVLVFSPA